MRATLPASSDLADVKAQLGTLQSGMAALEQVAQMRADLAALQQSHAELLELRASCADTAQGAAAAQAAAQAAAEQLDGVQGGLKRLTDALTDLEGIAMEVDQVSAQVCSRCIALVLIWAGLLRFRSCKCQHA